MNYPIYTVDAFTDKVFGGNPAASLLSFTRISANRGDAEISERE